VASLVGAMVEAMVGAMDEGKRDGFAVAGEDEGLRDTDGETVGDAVGLTLGASDTVGDAVGVS